MGLTETIGTAVRSTGRTDAGHSGHHDEQESECCDSAAHLVSVLERGGSEKAHLRATVPQANSVTLTEFPQVWRSRRFSQGIRSHVTELSGGGAGIRNADSGFGFRKGTDPAAGKSAI